MQLSLALLHALRGRKSTAGHLYYGERTHNTPSKRVLRASICMSFSLSTIYSSRIPQEGSGLMLACI
jgi:hypothetical protein